MRVPDIYFLNISTKTSIFFSFFFFCIFFRKRSLQWKIRRFTLDSETEHDAHTATVWPTVAASVNV